MKSLPKNLKKEPFTTQEAITAGISKIELKGLVTDGLCYSVARGIYMPSNLDYNEEYQFKVATLIVGEPSAICLISALSIYQLTDQIPKKTWIIVPNTKRTNEKGIKLLRQRDPQWNIGIQKHNGYSITSVERTIVDCFCYARIIGLNTAVESLRDALAKKLTTGSKVLEMAKKMGVLHRLFPYIAATAT